MPFSFSHLADSAIAFGGQYPLVAGCYVVGLCDVLTFCAARAILKAVR